MKIKKIYIINLKRRKDKLKKMIKKINDIDEDGNIDVEIFEAFDGSKLDNNYLKDNNMAVLDDWRDPFKNTKINMGEIGCALSHHKIWELIVKNNYNHCLIIEDDACFEEDFIKKVSKIDLPITTDLLYFGRKKFVEKEESYSDILIKPEFSYWTVGYYLTYSGALKFIKSNFIQNLIPVDEFIPIGFGKDHPSSKRKYSESFRIDKLVAFTLKNLLIKPEDGAFLDSDVENSTNINFSREYYKDHTITLLLNDKYKYSDKFNRLIDSLNKYTICHTITDIEDDIKQLEKSEVFNNELFIYIDPLHCVAMTGINEIIDKFLLFNKKIIFGVQKHSTNDMNIYNYGEYYKYIDQNTFIGYRKDLLTYFKISKENRIKYIKDRDDIGFDSNCHLFFNLKLNLQDFNVDVVKSRLVNRVKENLPCFIISNDNVIDNNIFNNITNYIPLNFRGSYGYNTQNNLKRDLDNKKIIITIFVDNIELTLNSLDNIKYPDKNITILLYVNNKNIDEKYIKKIKNKFKNVEVKKYTDKNNEIESINKFNNSTDYLLYIDGNVKITNKNILIELIKLNKNVVAPLMFNNNNPNFNMILNRSSNDILPDYNNILYKQTTGCWNVPYINKIALIKTDILDKIKLKYIFDLNGKIDNNNLIFTYLDNQDKYGEWE